MATTCCIDDLDRVLERALRVEGAAAPLMPQHNSMAQSLLMKIVSERRADFRPAFIRSAEAMLTDDAESIMLEVVFGDAPDDVVGLFFGRDDEVFGAGYVEGHGDDEHGALSRGLSFSPRLFTIFSAAILGAVRRRGRPFFYAFGPGGPSGGTSKNRELSQ